MDRPVVFFDNTCGFCHRSVRLLLRIGAARHVYFAPRLGATFQELISSEVASRLPDSLLFFHQGKIYSKSRAIAAICKSLPWPWKFGAFISYFPVSWGDFLYDQVARRRYALSGKSAGCEVAWYKIGPALLP
ncbi:MAG: DCC1-like thiol-disulfide oxidoreductase family protein [Flavobacteriales bacterium]|nr:DCC1-like thiol-disulfide oxidoreductase family protein [Flavobacteriales bacterium]MDW8431438.1 DCC1-like thiol-disulfide oxidoreductase family protein [Flavobacteriales bacterium]